MSLTGLKFALLIIFASLISNVRMQANSTVPMNTTVNATTLRLTTVSACNLVTVCVPTCNNGTNGINGTNGTNGTTSATTLAPTTLAGCNANGTCCVCLTVCSGGNQTAGPNQQAGGPSAPQSAPVNAFANVDPRICFVLSNIQPSLTAAQIATLAATRASWSAVTDAAIWSTNCKAALQYYQYLEDLVVSTNDSFVTYTRISSVVGCKPDCNFNRLLSGSNIFSANQALFGQTVIGYLPPNVGAQCRQQFSSLVSAASATNASYLASNLATLSLLTPAQMGAFSPADSLSLAQALSTNGKKLAPSMAKSLGANINSNQTLSGIASIASGLPLTVFSNTAAATLVSLVSSMDLGNMDSFRKGFIATKIAASNSATNIQSLLQSTSDSSIVNSIPAALFGTLNINISAIPAANLPKAYLKSYARTQLANTSLSSITDSSTLAKILPGITKSDLATVTDALKLTTVINLMSASLVNSIALSSNQRSAVLSSLVSSLSNIAGSTNATVYLANLTSAQLSSLYPLFIEANSTVLSGFASLPFASLTFTNLISYVAQLTSSQCCSYTKSGRKLFASYAAPYLFSYNNLALSDLYSLGPCLVSAMPIAYLRNLSSTVFSSYYPTLGSAFQPDADETTVVSAFVMTLAANASSQDTLVFSTLYDLALYYDFTSTYANSITSLGWTSNGAALMTTIKTARDPTDSTVQTCQLGLTNSATVQTSISTYGTKFVSKYLTSLSGRRKRDASSLTCSQLNDISTSLNQLTVAQIAAVSTSEFYSCQTLLGAASNSWSSSQLTQLAANAKAYYGTAANISDANIASLNVIMVGFSSSDLSTLVFSSTTSISALGALSGWSTAQISALATPLTTYGTSVLSGTITSDFITSAGNLMCCLTPTQINSITSPVFAQSVSALAKISLTCPNIGTWYTFAKSTTTYSSLLTSTSALTELGTILSGITIADLSLVAVDSISSISSSAFKYMPAATVNSLSLTQLSSLSTDQVTALTNSPNYASFSSTISGSLSSISTGGTSVAGTTSGSSGLVVSISFLTLSTTLISVLMFLKF